MDGLRQIVGLAALLAGQVGVARLLHHLGALPWLRVGWEDPAAWLAVVAPEDAVMAALRLVALAAAYWLLVSTVAYTLARASRLPGAVRSTQWATLPAVRRMADRAVAVVLAGSTVAVGAQGLAVAEVVAPPAISAPADLPGDPGAAPPPGPGEQGAAPPPGPGEQGAAPPPGHPEPATAPPGRDAAPHAPVSPDPATHVVVPGDNLWAITAGLLGPDATDGQIHGPWRALVEANRERLRSGDPDLIYPGEQVVVPPDQGR